MTRNYEIVSLSCLNPQNVARFVEEGQQSSRDNSNSWVIY